MELYNFKEQIVKERINASNPHEIIYGETGSGKSYFQMNEIREILKQTSILPCKNHCFDIFSLPEYNDSPYTRDEEIAFKTDRIAAMLGKNVRDYSNEDFSILYNVTKELYKNKNRFTNEEFRSALASYEFEHQLDMSSNFKSSVLALLDLFEDYHAPLLGTNKRIIIYDLHQDIYRDYMVLAAVFDDIWNRVHQYNKKEEQTFLFLEDT